MPDSLYGIDASAYRLFAQQTSDILFEYCLSINSAKQVWENISAWATVTIPPSPIVFERKTAYALKAFPDIFSALQEITDDEQLAELYRLWQSAHSNGFAIGTFRIHCNDYRVLNWQIYVVALPMHGHHTVQGERHFLCSIKDITWQHASFEEHRQDELARQNVELQMTRERYQFLADNMSDIVVLRDVRTHTLLYVSPSIYHVLGYTPEEYYDLSREGALVHPEDRLFAIAILNKALEKENNEGTVVTRLRHAQGYYVWLESRVRVLSNEQGEPFATISASRDITRRVETEQALKKSENLYRLLADNMHDAIMLYDKDFHLLFVSPSVQSVLGFSVAEYSTLQNGELVHPDDLAGVIAHIQQAFIEAEKRLVMRYRVRHKEGHYIWIESRAHIVDDDTHTMSSIWQVRDITSEVEADEVKERARREMRLALEHEQNVNRIRTHFMTMASHQFRTPLTVIRSNADLINLQLMAIKNSKDLSHAMSDVEQRRIALMENSVGRLNAEVDRIVGMLEDISLLADIEANRIQYAPERYDVCALLYERINEFSARTSRQIVFEPKTEPCMMRFDWFLLQQAFDQILSNALKYSEGKKSPYVSLFATEQEVYITVQDFGIGIPEQEQNNIFRSFSRAHNALNIQGSGMGLVIAQALVALHSGMITFTSTAQTDIQQKKSTHANDADTSETTFTIILPKNIV